jgi:hypothetical protein
MLLELNNAAAKEFEGRNELEAEYWSGAQFAIHDTKDPMDDMQS